MIHTDNNLMFFGVFTERKRSLGQGNIFVPVCPSVHGGGWGVTGRGGVPGGDPSPGRLLLLAVRILLECILFFFYDRRNKHLTSNLNQ